MTLVWGTSTGGVGAAVEPAHLTVLGTPADKGRGGSPLGMCCRVQAAWGFHESWLWLLGVHPHEGLGLSRGLGVFAF